MAETHDIGGRPTKYRKEFTALAYQLSLLGATDLQIAEALNVSGDTVYEWKNKHKGFSEALRKGKLIADAQVASGLFKRAKGFKYDEVTYERLELGEPLEENPIKSPVYKRKVVTKYVPPDTGAAMSWLKNRHKEIWRDKQEIGIEFEQMTDEQIDKVFEKVMEAARKKESYE